MVYQETDSGCIFFLSFENLGIIVRSTSGTYADGAIAQLGERYNGIVEVVGSIPSGSTIQINNLVAI